MFTNRIKQYLQEIKAAESADKWDAWCEKVAKELAHDRRELEAGRMTVEQFDAKW